MSADDALKGDLPKAIAAVIALNLHIFYESRQISGIRKRLFTQQFMEQHFGAIHQAQLREPIVHMGYPDPGDGQYTAKLPYSDWYKYCALQATHQSEVEAITTASLAVLTAGLVDGNYALAVGALYLAGRIVRKVNSDGAGKKHRRGRKIGNAICLLSVFVGFGVFIDHCIQ